MENRRTALLTRIGLELRRRRLMLDLSQERMAELVDMHRTYYGAIERGLKDVRVLTLERLATALKTRVSEIMGEAERGA
jgi:transcriptional regulator with XRE-family HTH domain